MWLEQSELSQEIDVNSLKNLILNFCKNSFGQDKIVQQLGDIHIRFENRNIIFRCFKPQEFNFGRMQWVIPSVDFEFEWKKQPE